MHCLKLWHAQPDKMFYHGEVIFNSNYLRKNYQVSTVLWFSYVFLFQMKYIVSKKIIMFDILKIFKSYQFTGRLYNRK